MNPVGRGNGGEQHFVFQPLSIDRRAECGAASLGARHGEGLPMRVLELSQSGVGARTRALVEHDGCAAGLPGSAWLDNEVGGDQ